MKSHFKLHTPYSTLHTDSHVNGGNADGDLLQHVQQDADGVEGGEDGDVVFHGAAADLITVGVAGHAADVVGVDNVADVAPADGLKDLVAALGELFLDSGADAVLLEEAGGAASMISLLPSLILRRMWVRMPFCLRNRAVPSVASMLKPRS